MKVLFAVPWPSRSGGGVFDAVRNLAINEQCSMDIEAEVFSLEDEFFSRDAPLWAPLSPKVFAVKGPKKLGYAPGMLPAMINANPDIIHCHGLWLYQSFACLNWHKHERRPYLVSPHGMLDPGDLIKSVWKKRLARLLFQGQHLQRAACVHALCESEARAIRNYGIKSQICVIPNGVDLPNLSPLSKIPETGKNNQDRKVLLYLGRITPKKGLASLIDAWSLLMKGGSANASAWHLHIAGWEQHGHESELKAQSVLLGVSESITFLGPRHGEEKDAAYREADAYILPSLSEGLPLVVLEAWSYALPVLMTPHCNLPEGYGAGAAIRVEASASDICTGIGQLVSMTDAERKQMGARGRQLVESKFTWKSVATKMNAVYKWALGAGGKPECVMN